MKNIKTKYGYFEIKQLERGKIFLDNDEYFYVRIFHSFTELHEEEFDIDLSLIDQGFSIVNKQINICNHRINTSMILKNMDKPDQ